MKIILEFDVKGYERESDFDGGRIYTLPGVSYSLNEAPPAILVDFLVETLAAEEHIIQDFIKIVGVVRNDEQITVVDGKIKA